MAVIKSTIKPTSSQLIQGGLPNINTTLYNAGKVEISKIQNGTSLSSFVNFTGLASQTSYSVYFIARSVYGEYTAIKTYTLQTDERNEGANLIIPTVGEVSTTALLQALSVVLPIDINRLIFSRSEEYSSTVSPSNQTIGTKINQYWIIIAPDAYNNSPTPIQLANEMLNEGKQNELIALIPQFFQQQGIRITPVKKPQPKFIVSPTIGPTGYYALQVTGELIDAGKVFAIVTNRGVIGNIKPTSYQVSNGLMADNTALDERYAKMAETGSSGDGYILFDELGDWTEYNVYVTAGNDMPYELVDLMGDSNVVHLIGKTFKNPSKSDLLCVF